MTTPTAAHDSMNTTDPTLPERLRAALELLESVAIDTTLLDVLDTDERRRLHQAVARVHDPDPGIRRQKLKARERERNADNIRRADEMLNQTGIRTLRRRPVFTTPNYFAPKQIGQLESGVHAQPDATPEPQQASEQTHCYVCKQKHSLLHHFYDQMCPACGDFNFAKRTKRPTYRPRGADHRSPRQNRLPGRHLAVSRRRTR